MRVLRSARGAIVTDAEGRELIDGFAGLWCVNAGYGQESIVEAAAAADAPACPTPPAISTSGAEAPIRLAAALAERAPGDLNHVYFTPRRLGRGGQHDPLHPLLLACQGPAAARPVHLGRAGLSRLDHHGRGADRAAGVPRGVRRALRLAAQDPVALHLSQPARAATRRRSSRPRWPNCAPRSPRSARNASPPSTSSRSRARAGCWCRRRAG